ncbi:hypothetical protein BO83DRAFT_404099 [Aspergillus eucalypticola CBS 122712]|uniref:NAD-dependent epimerase/dehydratase domain-containing protein n=1 Tax=Aspergillus eucalypticola (strain CBS 122712 / IBT 29274) TaxID=1448314 RepID=A0A317ULA9_ASPEC|nr:uncharacterized protein BO83DRAFT_404099 [Aspergillus eucalypticola CBS 122712]PWY62169.1 hypothetical protein BO83DRAFT_404099 [Aspergillus eucalypticola CBS 122712]
MYESPISKNTGPTLIHLRAERNQPILQPRRQKPWTEQLDIHALVRSEAQASTVQKLGVKPVTFLQLQRHTDRLEKIAEDFDVIIHVGAGWHTPSAKALITGQGTRKKAQNPNRAAAAPHYIQISGTSNPSDRPHTDNYTDTHLFTDVEDIYSYVKYRESRETYHQRTTDLTVCETGKALGVTTYILSAMIADALNSDAVSVVGTGNTVWSHVHIQDLAGLCVVMLQKICTGVEIPSGEKGIYFCETGEYSHREFSERLAIAACELGVLSSSDEAGEKLAMGSVSRAELSFAANARTKAVLGRKVGWMPSHGDERETTFHDEVSAFVENPPGERDVPEFLRKR